MKLELAALLCKEAVFRFGLHVLGLLELDVDLIRLLESWHYFTFLKIGSSFSFQLAAATAFVYFSLLCIPVADPSKKWEAQELLGSLFVGSF